MTRRFNPYDTLFNYTSVWTVIFNDVPVHFHADQNHAIHMSKFQYLILELFMIVGLPQSVDLDTGSYLSRTVALRNCFGTRQIVHTNWVNSHRYGTLLRIRWVLGCNPCLESSCAFRLHLDKRKSKVHQDRWREHGQWLSLGFRALFLLVFRRPPCHWSAVSSVLVWEILRLKTWSSWRSFRFSSMC